MTQNIEILYEDNHVIVVNKEPGELVQPDPSGAPALEQRVKEYLRVKYNKPGEAFLGVVHRIDRPVSGVVLFAKTSKALTRLNEQLREGGFKKSYLAIVENRPKSDEALLEDYISRNTKINKSFVSNSKREGSKLAKLKYRLVAASDNYFLLDVELMTGRHHQIRCQLSSMGCSIRGDVKYGARRSLPQGGISLHSHIMEFTHPTLNQRVKIKANPPKNDNLWAEFWKVVK
ncbi:MAG: RNA pseudouridine synthase [Rikenellaceae bacterium]